MRKIATLLILFFVLIYPASSLKTFEFNETDKVSLIPEAEDPDADRLVYSFTEPLDENGEWQTDYGDAGEYTVTIAVSDGVNEVSEEVLIIVNKKEAKPTIDGAEPQEDLVTIDEGNSITFSIAASDPNNDELTYEWNLNGKIVSNKDSMIFETNYQDNGGYNVSVTVSDGVFPVSKEWDLKVNDVNLDALLDQINDITVLETETASLELPDFKQYGLSYTISEPLGNDNEWKTSYGDGGEYEVTLKVEGNGFEGEAQVKVTVQNKDRAPKFVGLRDVSVRENEQLSIELNAADPDDDEIFFSVEDIPENANLDGNIFTWIPGFDFVKKNNIFHYILDKFRLLSKSVSVVFIAQSNELSDSKKIKIKVKENNRPFVLEPIEDIEVNEGEEVVIEPISNDPDNDRVKFSYLGFMRKNSKATNFEDSGSYIVKVTATDGFFTETKFIGIRVNDVNRKPIFNKIENIEVSEGNELRIELSASDPDNDVVSFSAIDLPEGAVLRDNLFVWKPDFEFVNGTRKEALVEFAADDGTDSVIENVKITVLNVNQAPKIVDFSDNLIALRNEPTLFEVNAVDIDGDELTYEWDFGFLDKFEDINKHQRIFTTSGSKKVEVTVSDGLESVSKVWNVEVV